MRPTAKAIGRGIAFLAAAQARDGSFSTQLSPGKRPFQGHEELVTTFTPALMLQALSSIKDAQPVCEQLARWLLGQQGANGAFNYWPAGAAERQIRPYPDDLDDTACALAGLHVHNPTLLDGAQLAKLVRLLVAAETKAGGPYRTWLVPQTAAVDWQDIDLVVNSNILYLLQQVAERLPALQALVAKAVQAGEIVSPYYPVSLVVMYFLARVCPPGETARQLIRHILQQQKNDIWPSPGQTALACTALKRLGHHAPQPKAIEYLIARQLPDGSWPAEAVWLDRARGRDKRYAGSSALTTAFVLEALAGSAFTPTAPTLRKTSPLSSVFRTIAATAKARIAKWPVPVRPQAQAALRNLQRGDTGREIILLPHMFAESLAVRPALPNGLLATLSVANIFGWMAYTIYDDILDGEADKPLISVANIAMRQSLQHFALALPADALFRQSVRAAFDRIDAANAWEAAQCRFVCDDSAIVVGPLPNYPSAVFLAERSVGHSLTLMAMLAAAGIPPNSQQVTLFEKGFRHYLAARQLNDDLHDWQQDIRKGQISYVVAALLRQADIAPGKHSFAQLLPQLERQFWQRAVGGLCAQTSRQLAQSRRAFLRSGLFSQDNIFFKLISRLEQGVARTLNEQKRAQEFLKHYVAKIPDKQAG